SFVFAMFPHDIWRLQLRDDLPHRLDGNAHLQHGISRIDLVQWDLAERFERKSDFLRVERRKEIKHVSKVFGDVEASRHRSNRQAYYRANCSQAAAPLESSL